MIQWFNDPMIQWSNDPMILWFHDLISLQPSSGSPWSSAALKAESLCQGGEGMAYLPTKYLSVPGHKESSHDID